MGLPCILSVMVFAVAANAEAREAVAVDAEVAATDAETKAAAELAATEAVAVDAEAAADGEMKAAAEVVAAAEAVTAAHHDAEAADLVKCCVTGQMITATEAEERQCYMESMEAEYSYGDAPSPQEKQHLQRSRTRGKKKKKKKKK